MENKNTPHPHPHPLPRPPELIARAKRKGGKKSRSLQIGVPLSRKCSDKRPIY